MNRKYAKPLFALIESNWAARWPYFKKVRGGPPGGRTFRRVLDTGGAVFVFVWPDPKGSERFFCEFGWSQSGNPPASRAGHDFPMDQPKAAFERPEMICGVQALWGDNGIGAWQVPDPVETFDPSSFSGDSAAAGREFMARLQQKNNMTDAQAESLVAPLVADLTHKLERVVMPYLQEYEDTVASGKRAG